MRGVGVDLPFKRFLSGIYCVTEQIILNFLHKIPGSELKKHVQPE